MTCSSHQPSSIVIRSAIFPRDKQNVAALFLAYAHSLPIDLSYQNFAAELAALPGQYAAEERGAVFLAQTDSSVVLPPQPADVRQMDGASIARTCNVETVGCVAIRPFTSKTYAMLHTCELKRLYLAPKFRGRGVAKLLVSAALQKARELGYEIMLLDTLNTMLAARRLYESLGFKEIQEYHQSIKGVVFYRLDL